MSLKGSKSCMKKLSLRILVLSIRTNVSSRLGYQSARKKGQAISQKIKSKVQGLSGATGLVRFSEESHTG